MTALRDIGEFGIIDRLAKLASTSPNVVEGIGDDCAVVRVGNEMLAVTCDMLIQDVHFRVHRERLQEIGWKAAAASLSDVASMGASPLFALVSCAAPSDFEMEALEEIFRGLNACLGEYGAVLAGGDTTCCESHLVLDLMLAGRVEDRYARRSGARPGDAIAVTGYPGRSAAGLQAQEQGIDAPALIEAHTRPIPRVAEGRWLLPRVHAMIDVSDGVVQDAGHIAEASNLLVDIDALAVPIAPELADFCHAHGADPNALALAGGEDYELAVALPPNDAEAICADFEKEFGLPLTVIGACADGPAEVRVNGEKPDSGGFDHFRAL